MDTDQSTATLPGIIENRGAIITGGGRGLTC